jgi:hypothetical protein
MNLDDYINIIIESILLLNLNIPNNIIDKFKTHKTNLKNNVLELENYIYSSNLVSKVIEANWKINRFIWDYEYFKLDRDNYDEIFNFYLIMIHNIPYFQPHSDNVIPGCNILYKNINNYKIYYEHKLNYNTSASYMRLLDWKSKRITQNFNCYCENHMLKLNNIFCEKNL